MAIAADNVENILRMPDRFSNHVAKASRITRDPSDLAANPGLLVIGDFSSRLFWQSLWSFGSRLAEEEAAGRRIQKADPQSLLVEVPGIDGRGPDHFVVHALGHGVPWVQEGLGFFEPEVQVRATVAAEEILQAAGAGFDMGRRAVLSVRIAKEGELVEVE